MRKTVRAIIIDKKMRVFLVQHQERNKKDQGKWATPGGGIESTDSNQKDALLRELTEEFGTVNKNFFQIGELLFNSTRPGRLDYFYLVKFTGSDLSPQVPDEIFHSKWFEVTEAENLNFFFGFEFILIKNALSQLQNST